MKKFSLNLSLSYLGIIGSIYQLVVNPTWVCAIALLFFLLNINARKVFLFYREKRENEFKERVERLEKDLQNVSTALKLKGYIR